MKPVYFGLYKFWRHLEVCSKLKTEMKQIVARKKHTSWENKAIILITAKGERVQIDKQKLLGF